MPHSSFLIPRYFDLIWLILLAIYIVAGTWLVPFHGDESTQIHMSRDYAYQFIERDLNRVRFRNDSPDPAEQYLRLINGSVNKYLIGLAWHAGGFGLSDVNDEWQWEEDWEYNHQNGYAPTEAFLHAVRLPSALLLASGVWAMFALGQVTGSRLTAYLASLYYALNPALLINGRRAMMEGSLILSELLVVLAGVLWLRRPRWWTALLLGGAGGFALSSKHTNLFTVGAIFAACAFYPFIDRRARRQQGALLRHALLLILAVVVLAGVFYALNPVWWGSNPLEHTVLILRLRSDLLAGQKAAFGGYENRLDQLAGFVRQALVNLPQYYEAPNWGTWLTDQIARYEASPLRGVSLGGSLPGAFVLLVLVGSGAWGVARRSSLALSTRWGILVWVLIVSLLTLALTPVEWQRYYLSVYPVIGLLASFGIARLFERIKAGH